MLLCSVGQGVLMSWVKYSNIVCVVVGSTDLVASVICDSKISVPMKVLLFCTSAGSDAAKSLSQVPSAVAESRILSGEAEVVLGDVKSIGARINRLFMASLNSSWFIRRRASSLFDAMKYWSLEDADSVVAMIAVVWFDKGYSVAGGKRFRQFGSFDVC